MPVAAVAALVAVPGALAATGSSEAAPRAVPLIPKPFDTASLRRQARREQGRARRREQRRAESAEAQVAIPPQLEAIAQCESHGNPRAIGGGGQFRGKYQFTYATWAAVGGSGDPAAAPESEQGAPSVARGARDGHGSRVTALPGTMSSRPSDQRTQALWPPS